MRRLTWENSSDNTADYNAARTVTERKRLDARYQAIALGIGVTQLDFMGIRATTPESRASLLNAQVLKFYRLLTKPVMFPS